MLLRSPRRTLSCTWRSSASAQTESPFQDPLQHLQPCHQQQQESKTRRFSHWGTTLGWPSLAAVAAGTLTGVR